MTRKKFEVEGFSLHIDTSILKYDDFDYWKDLVDKSFELIN